MNNLYNRYQLFSTVFVRVSVVLNLLKRCTVKYLVSAHPQLLD